MILDSRQGRYDLVQRLLAQGADPRLKNQDGMTALDLAASLGSLQCLRAAGES